MLAELARTDFPRYLQRLKEIVRAELIPAETRLSDAEGCPEDIAARLRELGLFGMTIPTRHGGLGLDMEQQVLVTLALTYASACFRSRVSTTLGLCSQAILFNGTVAQCARYLPEMASGQLTAAFALTEEGAGSDAGAVATVAARNGSDYVLTGRKRYITNANIAGLFVVIARVDPSKAGPAGLAAFLIERGTPGLTTGPVDVKLGQAGAPTAEVILDGCRVPSSALLGGREGDGFKNAMAGINTARLHVAATCVGQSERLLDEALAYARSRRQFGQAIAEFQSVGNMLAEMRAESLAGRAMVLDTARRFSSPPDAHVVADIASCKLFASEMVCRVADRAVQIHGGAGYMEATAVARLYRDVRLFRLFEGTSQIQQIVIARHLIAHGRREP